MLFFFTATDQFLLLKLFLCFESNWRFVEGKLWGKIQLHQNCWYLTNFSCSTENNLVRLSGGNIFFPRNSLYVSMTYKMYEAKNQTNFEKFVCQNLRHVFYERSHTFKSFLSMLKSLIKFTEHKQKLKPTKVMSE